MKNLTCIVCPNSCALTIDENTLVVTGYKCLRGVKFAQDELTNPLRTLTTTVATTIKEYPVIAVKTTGEIPKGLIFELMNQLNEITITSPLPLGTLIINDFNGTGVSVVTSQTMIKEDVYVK